MSRPAHGVAFAGGAVVTSEEVTGSMGGLQLPNKPKMERNERGGTSVLGLDRLAEEKRAEKRGLLREEDPGMTNGFIRPMAKRYREHLPETPSYTGGANREALERIQRRERERDDRRRGNAPFSRQGDRRSEPIRKGDTSSPRAPSPSEKRQKTSHQDSERDRSDWALTPQRQGSYYRQEGGRTPLRPTTSSGGASSRRYPTSARPGTTRSEGTQANDASYDREFYLQDEDGARDEFEDPFLGDKSKMEERERDLERKQGKRVSAKQSQYNEDNNRWEENRMLFSGVAYRPELDTDFDDTAEARVHLIVNDVKPPFLDGRMVFTKQMEPVYPIKDPTSDLAIICRKGSQLLRDLREQRDRLKNVNKFWEISGTQIGKAMGVSDTPKPPEGDDKRSVSQEVSYNFGN